jgi:Helix-loop-helix DNA-binding domain
MLDNFFTTLNSNHLNSSDIWLPGQPQDKGVFGMEWSEELPPTFEGSTTSLSQPTLLPYGVDKGNSDLLNTSMGASSEVLAAASMLYQNGINGIGFGSTSSHHLFPDHGLPFTGVNGNLSTTGSPVKNMRLDDRHGLKSLRSQSIQKRLSQELHTSEMFFDVQQSRPLDQQTSAKVRTLRWGSDASFADHCYLAPPDQPNEEERTKDLLNNLECFEPQSSSTDTRAPTPVRPIHDHCGEWVGMNGTDEDPVGGNDDRDDGDIDVEPRKRLKFDARVEEDDSDVNSMTPRSKKSKGSGNGKAKLVSTENLSRKPKSQHGNKPARENLTEEQKRTNHILSEQKRRNLIKQGFEELCSLVPELRGGGFSKSAMLIQAAEWLEDMLRGNEILKNQLSELKAMNGIAIS